MTSLEEDYCNISRIFFLVGLAKITTQIIRVRVMVFNATFNNISVISWLSAAVLLVEETGIPGENYRPVTSHCQTLSHNIVSSTPRHEWDPDSQL